MNNQSKLRIWFAVCIGMFAFTCLGQPSLNLVPRLCDEGDFNGAVALLKSALEDGKVSAEQRKSIETEIERIARIREDYSDTTESLYSALTRTVSGLTRKEFNEWIDEGRFDSHIIDGETRFVGTSVNNLFFRYPELNSRRTSGKTSKTEASYQKALLENCRTIKKAAHAENTPYVLPHRFKCTMTVTVKKDAVPAKETISAWLPIPRTYPFQKDFKVLGSSPEIKVLAPEDSPIRSAYFELAASKNKETRFEISYEYTASAVCFDLDQKKIQPIDLKNPELKKFTDESPHVVFTKSIKDVSNEIVGKEKNPMLQAKAFYDWIAESIKYSYAREYSTLTNISDYCFGNRYGDCGQEAMLFITLCRSKGIPARWQSGWSHFPGAKTMHDWCEIYLEPYGWMPCDPWAGIFAMRYCTELSPKEQRELRDFYFGGLDQYRMSANGDHSAALNPPKKFFRSDDVDFQRGELETANQNVYFGKFSYKFEAAKLP